MHLRQVAGEIETQFNAQVVQGGVDVGSKGIFGGGYMITIGDPEFDDLPGAIRGVCW